MKPVPLSTFLTFVSSTGITKYNAADELRNPYDPAHDWYKAFRESAIPAIVDHNPSVLSTLPDVLTDKRKISHYTECGEALGRWIETTDYEVLEVVDGRTWHHGDLPVRVNPELRVRIADEVYLTKLHMRQQAMKKAGLDAYGYLVRETYDDGLGRPALLDVRKKTPFRVPPRSTVKVARMVRAEATALLAHLRAGGIAA